VSRTRSVVAAEVWAVVFELFKGRRGVVTAVAAEYGLTQAVMHSLLSLEPGEGRPMGALAMQWGCDASNVTSTVDRLEELGLAARQPDPADRRVKTVVLTDRGTDTRAAILDQLRQPPPELLHLGVEELETLLDLLRRTGVTPDPDGPRWPRAERSARPPTATVA
jgi:DNA-binding MarR family transcriptional regulator